MERNWDDWFTALYHEKYDKLYRVAYHLTGSVETGEELVQEAFLLAFIRGGKFWNHPVPEAWLMQTVNNLARNENRRFSSKEISLETQFQLAAPETDPGIGELLPSRLPEKDREILIWRFEEQLDYREIADRLGISETACRSRVFRALERCRELLKEEKAHT